ncbi:MAG: hypothetical protein JO110_24425 [Acetobacteraceae bacterium]|nr:hypothetical protein [Acetobacteraceae bacterium]
MNRITAPRRPIGLAEFESSMAEALEQWRTHLRLDQAADLAAFDGGAALLAAGRELIRVREDDRWHAITAPEITIVESRAGHGMKWLDCVQRAAQAEAERAIAELRHRALSNQEAQALARQIAALTSIRDKLDHAAVMIGVGSRSGTI